MVMMPLLTLDQRCLDFFDMDPRLSPDYWARSWSSPGGAEAFYQDHVSIHNTFIRYPVSSGYAVKMWFNDYDHEAYHGWTWLWYWRAVIWHDFSKVAKGEWWCAIEAAPGGGNHYYIICSEEADATLVGAMIAATETKKKWIGK